jgi:hypothetical protein
LTEQNNNPQIEINATDSNSYNVEINSLGSISYGISSSLNTSYITMDNLKEYIKYPMIYNEILRTISEQAYNADGLYGQSIDRMVALPTLSYITTLRNKTNGMKNKKDKFNTILKILNVDRTTRDILRNLFINGIYVGILRDTTASNKNIDTGAMSVESIDRIEGLSLDDNL